MDEVLKAKIETIGRPTSTRNIRRKSVKTYSCFFRKTKLGEKSVRTRSSFFRHVSEHFSEFTSATSLHGVQYVGDRKRSYLERILWFSIISASLCVCLFFIKNTYDKWNLTPVIVTFSNSPTPVWKIPFPAITVCSETKFEQGTFNFTEYYYEHMKSSPNMTNEQLHQLDNAALLCDPEFVYVDIFNTTDDIAEFMQHTTPDILRRCGSLHLGRSCTEMFDPVVTEDGICYSFNMLDGDDVYTKEVYRGSNFLNHQKNSSGWSLEDGYRDSENMATFPKRTVSAGIRGGLKFELMGFEDKYNLCRGPVQGFKILLHHPGEIPRVSMQYFRVPYNQDVTVAVKPDMITTSQLLRDYDPHKRGCYFTTERRLRFYKYYTHQNCEMECFTNATLKNCGCVAFYMPHENGTLICGSRRRLCVDKSQYAIPSNIASNEFYTNLTRIDCDCLPSCTTLTYNAEMSHIDFTWKSYLYARYFYDLPIDLRLSIHSTLGFGNMMTRSHVTIFYKETQFISSERNELYGLTNFLATCGGLLGLFFGFSLISMIEILYFLSIRLIVNLRR